MIYSNTRTHARTHSVISSRLLSVQVI